MYKYGYQIIDILNVHAMNLQKETLYDLMGHADSLPARIKITLGE